MSRQRADGVLLGLVKIELLIRQRGITIVELSVATADHIENFWTGERRHNSLNYLMPNEFEILHLPHTQTQDSLGWSSEWV